MSLQEPARPGRRRTTLTMRGRCLLAGGIAMTISAIVLDERDLVRIGLFVVLLPVLAWVFARRARRTLRVTRTLAPDRVPAGDTVTATLRIAGGALLGALRIADTVPDAVGSSERYPPRFTVHRLGRRGARVTYPLRPAVRGPYGIGPLRGRGTDPLGLAEFSRDLLAPDRLLVLPRVTELTGRPIAGSTAVGRSADGGSRPGAGTPDVLIRPYQQGDEMRRVHWRSSARRDELMVRLDDRPDPTGITVLLDRRDAAHRGHGAGSSLEYAVELAASVSVHLLRRGEAVDLVVEDGTVLVAAGSGGEDDVVRHLDALAELRPSATTGLGGAAPIGPAAGVLAVLGATSADDVSGLVTAHPQGGHAVLLDVDGWGSRSSGGRAGDARQAAVRLRTSGWQATVVPAGFPVEQAWAAVCGDAGALAAADDGVPAGRSRGARDARGATRDGGATRDAGPSRRAGATASTSSTTTTGSTRGRATNGSDRATGAPDVSGGSAATGTSRSRDTTGRFHSAGATGTFRTPGGSRGSGGSPGAGATRTSHNSGTTAGVGATGSSRGSGATGTSRSSGTTGTSRGSGATGSGAAR